MNNHLIIGLGGTGGKVIRNLRKTIYRDCRELSPANTRIKYLLIDSSPEHMKVDDPEWKALGVNLQLDPPDQMELTGTGLKTFLEDVHSFPAIAPWIGDPKDWASIVNLGQGGQRVLGGQKRRLGRFLFARHAKDFANRLTLKIADLTAGAKASAAIHVVSGLAGGTGSGTLIDVISIIRKTYPDSSAYPIILYLLLPEENPKPNWNTGNYHANGYAALLELNALSVGAYRPYNLLGGGERYQNITDPFKICYLISDHNSNGMRFDVDKEIPDLIAETVYQKMLAEIGGTDKEIAKIQEWENLQIAHEGTMVGDHVKPERSRLFASFGIKKISYPEEEIRDHIGYALSRQALLQMLYNNWAQGYLNEPVNLAVQGFIGIASTQEDFHVDRPTFFLEKSFSSNTEEADQSAWKSIEDDWRNFIEKSAADMIEANDGNWLAKLRQTAEDRYSNRYRNAKGVVDYYNWKKDRVREYARELGELIDTKLCADLLEGRRSITEIETILNAFVELLARNDTDWQRQNEADIKLAAKERGIWMENMQRFEDLGVLAKLMPGNKEKIFEAGKGAITRYFILSTRIAAWEFAQQFVRALQTDLGTRAEYVKKSITAMKNAVVRCDANMAAHAPEENALQSEKVCLRLYNGDEVTRYMDALISSREFQNVQSRRARMQLHQSMMLERTTLKALPTSSDESALHDILEKSSHDTLKDYDAGAEGGSAESGVFNRLLAVSIIDKLQERFSGDDDKMRNELKEFLLKAGSLLPMDQAERQKKGPGTEYSDDNHKVTLIIMMPDVDAEEGFAKKLRDAMKAAVPDGAHVSFVDSGANRRHEITILRFVQLFPLRYVDVMKKLKEEYQNRMRDGDPKRRALEVHTEGDAESYPPIFVPPVENLVGPSLLLGMSLGVIRPKTGVGMESKGLFGALVIVDADDVPQYDLGTGYDGALQTCSNRNILGLLQKANGATLRTREDDKEMLGGLPVKLKELARTMSKGDDDRLKKMMDFANGASKEADLFLKN